MQASDEEIAQAQDELVALLQAWVDRGLPATEGAQIIAGFGNICLAQFGYSLRDVVERVSQMWPKHGGKP